MQKTTMLKNEQALAQRQWYTIDATDVVLGKLAVTIADLLRGKNKPSFTPNVDCGDFVIVTNSNKVKLSHDKASKEFWYSHSGYIGGLRKRSGEEMISKYSDELIRTAVKNMMPQNKLSRQLIKKLFIYKDAGKDHSAQQPQLIQVKY